MTILPRLTADQRRARLIRRHLLAPAAREKTAEAVAKALVGLHATDPATVFLAAAARMHRPTVPAIERSLYDVSAGTLALERIRCMRGTMFVVPARLAPAVRSATVRDTAGSPFSCRAMRWPICTSRA
uniref:Winged helix DNA-binding domain-containing protein n=1 Tax=Streptomyces sp. NBC_00003 TaxID=2903608 RepID=A0AAU2UY70_9ACTN